MVRRQAEFMLLYGVDSDTGAITRDSTNSSVYTPLGCMISQDIYPVHFLK